MELMTTKQVAEQLGLSSRSVYLLAATGKLAVFRLGLNGGMVRFRQEDLDAYSAMNARKNRLAEPGMRGRIPQPWFRASTNSWYVWLDGRQIPLGKTEREARKMFRHLTAGKKRSRPARSRSRLRLERTDKIYFIQDTETGVVKIGISLDPMLRLQNLQSGYPYQLVLLGTIPGTEQDEAELHVAFQQYHIRGEWFRGDDSFLAAIRAVIVQGRIAQ